MLNHQFCGHEGDITSHIEVAGSIAIHSSDRKWYKELVMGVNHDSHTDRRTLWYGNSYNY